MVENFVTEEEIREALLENIGETPTSERELTRSAMLGEDGPREPSGLVYWLSGEPPRGYAIYIRELNRLNFYSPGGERFETTDDIEGIIEVDRMMIELVNEMQEHQVMSVDELETASSEEIRVVGGDATFDRFEILLDVIGVLRRRGVIVQGEDESMYRLGV